MLRSALLATALTSGLAASALAQDGLATPRRSPPARVSQTIGMTEIAVDYHAPAVRGREIFGVKVPFGVVWRAGANENTTISVAHDVHVEGQPLEAGTYGLHMLPGPDTWEVIFSHDNEGWGSYRYDEGKDALRVTVTPRSAPHRERLAYLFDEVGDTEATLLLHWDTMAVPVRIAVNLEQVVLAPVREAARTDASAGWQFWHQAAEFGRDQDIDPNESFDWIERSVTARRTFSNLWTRSDLLAELGRNDEAKASRAEALELVTVNELSQLGYRYVLREDLENAVKIFEMVVEMDPPSWWPYTQLAGARRELGDDQGAAEAWRAALSKNPDPVTQGEIEAALAALDAG